MSFLEKSIPVEERILILTVIASKDIINRINHNLNDNVFLEQSSKHNLSSAMNSQSLYFYTSYSYADLYDEKEFDVIYPIDVSKAIECKTKVTSFINEWRCIPMGFVAKGHRTFCLIQFIDSIPNLIKGMNVMGKEMKEYPSNSIVLCSRETWLARKNVEW